MFTINFKYSRHVCTGLENPTSDDTRAVHLQRLHRAFVNYSFWSLCAAGERVYALCDFMNASTGGHSQQVLVPPHSSSFVCRMRRGGQQYIGLTPPQRTQRTSAFATARGDKSEENPKYITYCVVIRRGLSYEHRYHTHIQTLSSHYFAPYQGGGARVTTLFNNDFP